MGNGRRDGDEMVGDGVTEMEMMGKKGGGDMLWSIRGGGTW